MFNGEYYVKLSENNRFALPTSIAKSIKSSNLQLYFLSWDDNFLMLTEADFLTKLEQELAKLSSLRLEAQRLKAYIYGNLHTITIGDKGRIVVPSQLITRYNLAVDGEEIVLLGAGDHLQLWTKEKWGIFKTSAQLPRELTNIASLIESI